MGLSLASVFDDAYSQGHICLLLSFLLPLQEVTLSHQHQL